MRILLIGGTGTVGSQLVNVLRGKDVDLRVMTTSDEKAKLIPKGIEPVVANLEKKNTLPPAFKNVDRMFLLVPVSPKETQMGLNAVEAAKEYNINRIVYMTVFKAEEARVIPHFRSKLPVIEAIRKSGIHYTILEPNNFMQSDLMLKDAIKNQKVYPQPLGNVGLHRVDVRDIADAAARALIDTGYEDKHYPLLGPDKLTGPSIAEIYSKALGYEIKYGGNDLKQWAAQASQRLPRELVDDFTVMLQWYQEHGLYGTDAELAESRKIIGHEPRKFESFVKENISLFKA